MKFKLINEDNNSTNPVERVLKNRGITDVKKYLNVDHTSVIDRRNLDNIELAANTIVEHLKRGSNIFLQVDSDADGYTSSALFLNYIYRLNPEWFDLITYELHEGKEHGVILDRVLSKGYDLVVVIDAGTNQIEEHKLIKEQGTDIVIIDHHLSDVVGKDAIIVNNQLSNDYSNKSMCGVGIAYKVCQEIDSILGTIIADELLDLVAVGTVADLMDMRELETHYLTTLGLSNIQNPLLKGLVNKQAFSIGDELTRYGVAFSIAPLINATIRVGSSKDKRTMFNSMLESEYNKLVPSTKRGCAGQMETILEQALRNCTNNHSRQRKLKMSGAEVLIDQIESNSLYDNKIMIVRAGDEIHKNLVGLVAMELAAQYKHPVLLLKPYEINGEIVYQGSGRNYDRGELGNLKEFLMSSGMFNFAEGK